MSTTTSLNIEWRLRKFDELTTRELYVLLQLRSEVFVVEQQCVFQDMDGKDYDSIHLLGWVGDQLAASTRIVPPGVSYIYPSIGRVVTSPAFRGLGMGRLLMEQSIRETENLFGKQPIRIGAQLYLKEFYQSLGFEQSGEVYLEDGIEHIEMTRS
ncbi:MAG: GNAT family N-acetyltransferase [Chitinophagaceae bacterium]|nr:GNAT family N-acetyltransferase [Chitinophagaceae bacterium]